MSQNPEDHLPTYQVRPRFKVKSVDSIGQIIAKIRAGLDSENAACNGKVHSSFVTLRIHQADQHYWSPQLTLNFEESEQEGCIVRGLYGPRPSVWTMFIFFYAIIGLGILVITTIGLSSLSLGKSAGILWFIPILLLVFLTLYLVAYFGQKMGRNQMELLHNFFEDHTGLSMAEHD